jgi:hypothetical protein
MDREFVRNRTALELAIKSMDGKDGSGLNERKYDAGHEFYDRRILDRATAFLGFLQHGDK